MTGSQLSTGHGWLFVTTVERQLVPPRGVMMRARFVAVFAAGTLLLAGCGGSDGPTSAGTQPGGDPDTTTTAQANGGDPAGGTIDCASISKDDAATFAIYAQLFAQVRTVDALQGMKAMGFTPEQMAALLDKFDALKGSEGEVYGKPDEALVVFRTANDTYAAILAKGDSATDADFAPLNELEPDVAAWITAQATILDALNQACPDLA